MTTIRDHGRMLTHHPFIPYFDFALGKQIDSHAQRWTEMKAAKVDYRDKLSKGDLSARRDKVEQQKRDARRG